MQEYQRLERLLEQFEQGNTIAEADELWLQLGLRQLGLRQAGLR